MSTRKKLVITGAVTAVLALGAGIAYALWSGEGTGSGRARATVAVGATLAPADGTPDLYPGFTGGDLYFTIDNPNPYQITFTDMTAGAVTSSDETACPAANVTVTSPVTGLSLVAPPGTSGQLSITDVVSMSPDAPDGCQGVAFDIALTLVGTQSS